MSTDINTFRCHLGSEEASLTDDDIKIQLQLFLDAVGPREDVLLIPPDYTRFHSQAGKITRFICEHLNFIQSPDQVTERSVAGGNSHIPQIHILPALGTHAPMTQCQIKGMFGESLAAHQPSPFLVHDWRNDVETIGYAPAEMVCEATNGMLQQKWPAQLNRHVWSRRHHDPKKHPHKSLIISIGQVVPHEVMGMANYNKNLFVGVGGVEAINLSHFIGAVHGMERMMGRMDNPLRSILNYASVTFLEAELDLWYILTVIGRNKVTQQLEVKGLYIGKDIECYNQACRLSLKINFTLLDRAPTRIVVYLDEKEFHSTWLGNKAIYRTRMAIADDGELIILGPGIAKFGEDDEIDHLIRTYGYKGTPFVMEAMNESIGLQNNMSAAAHLIHGSSEGRFRIIYCPGHLTKEDVESVGFGYGDLESMLKRYDVNTLRDGWNTEMNDQGLVEEFYYISNPALGLWSLPSRFDAS